MALGAGVGGSAGLGGIRQAGELRFVGDDEFPGVGGIEDVLGVFLGELRKLGLDRGDAFLLPGGRSAPELRKSASVSSTKRCWIGRQRRDFRALAHGLDHRPQPVVQGERRVKIRDVRQHLAERLALGGIDRKPSPDDSAGPSRG